MYELNRCETCKHSYLFGIRRPVLGSQFDFARRALWQDKLSLLRAGGDRPRDVSQGLSVHFKSIRLLDEPITGRGMSEGLHHIIMATYFLIVGRDTPVRASSLLATIHS
jgi:hypothetical protein